MALQEAGLITAPDAAAEPPAVDCICTFCLYEAYEAKYGRLRWVIIHPDESEPPARAK